MSSENEKNAENHKDLFDVEPVKVSSVTAEEFLQKLDLVDDRWQGKSNWIFRGQNDATWELMPSLFRHWDENTPPDYEISLIDNFMRSANIANLPIPANSLGYSGYTTNPPYAVTVTQRNLRGEAGLRYGRQYDFSHVAFAIAQHSGVPTRLLDFTYEPLVAAYFAAEWGNLSDSLEISPKQRAEYFEDIFERFRNSPDNAMLALAKYSEKVNAKMAELPKEMAVWAIRMGDLEQTTLLYSDHPYSQILNLVSQMGIFLYETEFYESDGSPWRSFNGKLLKLVETGGIYKLTLPCTERQRLIGLLSRKRISPLYLKPSYEIVAKAVVKGMNEQRKSKQS